MNGSERDFLDTLLIALIPSIPLAALAIRNYLVSKTNTKRIDNRPTRDEMGEAIHAKANELIDQKINGSGGSQ